MVSKKSLDFWVENNLNVLLIGEHGIGKTAQVVDTFKRNNLRWLYFSASTMDPWVDMIGVPKETVDANGQKYLDLVRPKAFQYDEIDAIFFDELNRAPKKVRNAVMELMQFKSINGHRFNNLRMVWGAINPEDDDKTYDVERLDPAQKDRFHVHVELDYAPDREYFTQKYGADNARYAIEWWNALKDKKTVSPRRLDYALEVNRMGGNMRDVLPASSNVGKLVQILSNGIAKDKLIQLLNEGKKEEAKRFLLNENVYSEIEEWLIANAAKQSHIFPLLSEEKLSKLISENYNKQAVLKGILGDWRSEESTALRNVCKSIQASNVGKDLKSAIYEAIPKFESDNFGKEPIKWTPKMKTNASFVNVVDSWINDNKVSKGTVERKQILEEVQNMPADISPQLAKNVAEVLLQLIKHSYKKVISGSYSEILGPLNFALEKTNMNILSNQYFKMHCNKLIETEVERYVWIPSSK